MIVCETKLREYFRLDADTDQLGEISLKEEFRDVKKYYGLRTGKEISK